MTTVLVGDPGAHRRALGPIAARQLDRRLAKLPAAGTWLDIGDVEPGTVDQLVAVGVLCGRATSGSVSAGPASGRTGRRRTTDPDRLAEALRDALAPGGRLLFVEHGRASALHRAADALYSAAPFGCHVDRDVTGTLRRAGLLITDLERCTMPSAVPLLRPWVQGTAIVKAVR